MRQRLMIRIAFSIHKFPLQELRPRHITGAVFFVNDDIFIMFRLFCNSQPGQKESVEMQYLWTIDLYATGGVGGPFE